MKIKVNNEDQILEENTTISDLLQINQVEMPDMVTVQLNSNFVKKEDFPTIQIKDSDIVDFLYFMGGANMHFNQLHFSTKALHTPFLRKDPHGSLHMPVYDNVAYAFETAEELEQAFSGKKPRHMYSRISNPTVEHFERKMQAITDSFGVLAVSSGMAAISNLLITIAGSGDNIITSKHLFGNTYSLFEKTLGQWGLETRYVDLTQLDTVESLIDDKTQAIFFETITNPQLEGIEKVQDLIEDIKQALEVL